MSGFLAGLGGATAIAAESTYGLSGMIMKVAVPIITTATNPGVLVVGVFSFLSYRTVKFVDRMDARPKNHPSRTSWGESVKFIAFGDPAPTAKIPPASTTDLAVPTIAKVSDRIAIECKNTPELCADIKQAARRSLLQANLEWCNQDSKNCANYNKIINQMFPK